MFFSFFLMHRKNYQRNVKSLLVQKVQKSKKDVDMTVQSWWFLSVTAWCGEWSWAGQGAGAGRGGGTTVRAEEVENRCNFFFFWLILSVRQHKEKHRNIWWSLRRKTLVHTTWAHIKKKAYLQHWHTPKTMKRRSRHTKITNTVTSHRYWAT